MKKQTSKDFLIEYSIDETHIQKSLRQSNLRYFVLTLSCSMVAGSYMCYDFPGILSIQLQQEFHQKSAQINILYSVYSIPNIIIPLLGGYLLDYIGIRKAIFIFTLSILTGQSICAIGAFGSVKNFNLLILGRIIYGLGGEVLQVAQSSIITKWFKQQEQSLAFGISLSTMGLGSVLGGFLFPFFQNHFKKVFYPLVFGAGICSFSWLCAVILIFIDQKADKKENIVKERKSFEQNEETKVKLNDIKKLKACFWMICLITIFFYVSTYCYIANLQTLFINLYFIEEQYASQFVIIPYFIGLIFTPLFGLLIDKVGKRCIFMMVSSSLLILSHILVLVLAPNNNNTQQENDFFVLIPLSLFGLAFSIVSALIQPCIPIVCQSKIIGTGFGINTCGYNLGFVIVPIIAGRLIEFDESKVFGFFYYQIFFIGLSSCSLLLNIIMFFYDFLKNKKILHKSYYNQELNVGDSFLKSSKAIFVRMTFRR